MLLDQPVEGVQTPAVEALLIARRGKLVLEEYFHATTRDTLHETRSASKSMTATLIGAAMHAGAPLTLRSSVYDVYQYKTGDVAKRSMTLDHLMSMRSGFFCDDNNDDAPGNEDKMQEQTEEPDWYKYSLAVPLSTAPGTESVYCSMMPNLALGMVERSMGEPALDVFDRVVAAPLGIRNYAWFLDNVGHAYGGGGARFKPRDFMKIGEVMLEGGTWQGRRILSRDFAERASSPLHTLGTLEYGLLWWGTTYPYKGRTVRAYFAAGNGGQIVMAIPELELVIASFSANYASRAALFIQQEAVPKFLLPAIGKPGP
jgi:CubicO group peptidase (beta-lactamase class C family)